MKKRSAALMTAIFCMTALVSAIPASAAESTLNEDGSYTITTENFTYTASFQCCLETELVDADFMVIGIGYYQDGSGNGDYIVTPISSESARTGEGVGYLRYIGDMDLQVGDLLKFDGGYEVLGKVPPIYIPSEETKEVINLGNGVDILGEEFADVFRMQAALDQAEFLRTVQHYGFEKKNIDWGGVTVNWGDVNMDEQLDILDCIVVNKYLLGSSNLCFYTKHIGDVNMDDVLDSSDSLAILKEVVGLTTNFE